MVWFLDANHPGPRSSLESLVRFFFSLVLKPNLPIIRSSQGQAWKAASFSLNSLLLTLHGPGELVAAAPDDEVHLALGEDVLGLHQLLGVALGEKGKNQAGLERCFNTMNLIRQQKQLSTRYDGILLHIFTIEEKKC